jgi:hypothetical protein
MIVLEEQRRWHEDGRHRQIKVSLDVQLPFSCR